MRGNTTSQILGLKDGEFIKEAFSGWKSFEIHRTLKAKTISGRTGLFMWEHEEYPRLVTPHPDILRSGTHSSTKLDEKQAKAQKQTKLNARA